MKNNFKIYCKEKLDITSVESLILDYLNKHSPTTYYAENHELQCYAKKSRSFYDLLSLVSYYFEGDRKSELAYVLCNLLKEQKIKGIFCFNIVKNVFFSEELHPNYRSYYYTAENDSFSRCHDNMGVDRLSLDLIYELGKQFKNE
jgi:hypothetical protein